MRYIVVSILKVIYKALPWVSRVPLLFDLQLQSGSDFAPVILVNQDQPGFMRKLI